jgi:ethanolamine transporter EutH
MIYAYTIAQVIVACAAGLLCAVLGLAGRKPNDVTLGALVLVELLLLAQLVIALIAPGLGNHPSGNIAEFYVYLVSALLIPPLAIFWGLIERTRWSTVVLGVAAFAIAVMVFRMEQIWSVQLA